MVFVVESGDVQHFEHFSDVLRFLLIDNKWRWLVNRLAFGRRCVQLEIVVLKDLVVRVFHFLLNELHVMNADDRADHLEQGVQRHELVGFTTKQLPNFEEMPTLVEASPAVLFHEVPMLTTDST